MGLDITAYSKLVKVEEPPEMNEYGELPDGFWTGGYSLRWAEEHFPGRSEGIDPEGIYKIQSFDDDHVLAFRAGSYGGYGAWRDLLAKLAGHGSDHPIKGPFAELINFADNEGVIGPIVAAKLAKDFAAWAAEFERSCPENDREWFMEKYRLWQRAFEMAADGGAVDFH